MKSSGFEMKKEVYKKSRRLKDKKKITRTLKGQTSPKLVYLLNRGFDMKNQKDSDLILKFGG